MADPQTDPDSEAEPRRPTHFISERMSAVEGGLSRVEDEVGRLVTRVDGFGLNGSGQAIKALANASADLVALAQCAPQLVEIASERRDTAAFWRTLQRWVRWSNGTKAVLMTLVAAAAGTLTYYLAAHIWGLPGGGK